MTDDKGPAMLRMVRWRSILQDAERLRKPYAQDRHEALARLIHMADTRTARQGLLNWLQESLDDLRQRPHTKEDVRRLRAQYLDMKGKLLGRQLVMATELGYYSQNVAPDYGRVIHRYPTWATTRRLHYLFNEGNEVVVQGHVGTGKTHLAALFAEDLLKLPDSKYHVLTNISGIRDKSRKYETRIHHVSLLSEILRIWSNLPESARIFLAVDEPEANLRGGNTKSVQTYQDFRYMIRKLGIAKLEIWHTEAEQYRSIREDKSEKVFRIHKDQKNSFALTTRTKDGERTQRIEVVPELELLAFATRGMGSLDVDVDMSRLIRRLSKLSQLPDMKAAVREALSSSHFILKEFREEPDKKDTEAQRLEALVQRVLADPKSFLGPQQRGFDRETVRRKLNVTQRDSDYVCKLAWSRHHPARGRNLDLREIVSEIRRNRKKFLGKTQRSLDRDAIQAHFEITHRLARKAAKEAAKGA